jgi:alcohol dehydrogenase class IV
MQGPSPDPLSFTAPEFRFGDGVVSELPSVLDRLGVENPLVVTDTGVEDAGVLAEATAGLGDFETYYAATEPKTGDFDDLPASEVDGVVAVGGGSCLDSAKVAALLLAHGGDPASYLGTGNLPGPVAPLVAVPTTSGTGSQSTQTAVVTHDGVKRGISDERLRPSFALVDPALTFGLPRGVTARSGFDGFVHALESLTARDYRWIPERPITYQGANPVSRPLSRRALELVHGSLERATFDGDDREARRAMSLGSHLAGLAFSNAGLGAVHALASAVGGMTDEPHGTCLAVSLEPGLEYNAPVRSEEYAAVARHLGVGDSAEALVAEAARLRDSLGLPASFGDVGLDRSDTDDIVENTLVQERRLVTNPRTVTEDLAATVRAAFD